MLVRETLLGVIQVNLYCENLNIMTKTLQIKAIEMLRNNNKKKSIFYKIINITNNVRYYN